MSEMTLRGSLRQLQADLLKIKTVTDYYNQNGFALLQSDEEWRYFSAQDARVCPTCQGFEYGVTYRGNEIPSTFPDYEFDEWYIISPRVHKTYPGLSGLCRCKLVLQNPLETFERRLHDAKLDAIIIV